MLKKPTHSLMILVLILFISGSLLAQKVDLDKYHFSAEYKSLPTNPLPAGNRTYSVSSRGSSIANEAVANGSVVDRVNISGFKKVEGRAHINYNFDFGDLYIKSAVTSSRKEETKDKNNVVTSTRYYYKKTVTYSFAITAKITDEKGVVIGNFSSSNSSLTWNSTEFSSSSDLENYYRNSYNDIRREICSGHINGTINEANSTVNAKYGYVDNKNRDYIWIEAAKKFPEYQAQQDNWLLTKAFIETLKGNEAISSDQMAQAKPILDYFQSVKIKYPADEKSDKKMRYQAYFALATLYILIDDLDAAQKEAEGLIANDYDAKDGKRFLEEIGKIRKAFEINGVTTRHYFVDPELNTPPAR